VCGCLAAPHANSWFASPLPEISGKLELPRDADLQQAVPAEASFGISPPFPSEPDAEKVKLIRDEKSGSVIFNPFGPIKNICWPQGKTGIHTNIFFVEITIINPCRKICKGEPITANLT
jgi:hypothetical protein